MHSKTIQTCAYILPGIRTYANSTIQDISDKKLRIDFEPISSESTIIFDYNFSICVMRNNERQTGRWGFWLKDYTHDVIIDANDYTKNKNSSFVSSIVSPNITPQHATEAHFPGWETKARFIYTSKDTIKRSIGLSIRNESGNFTNPKYTQDDDFRYAEAQNDYEIFIGPSDDWNENIPATPCPTTCVVTEII